MHAEGEPRTASKTFPMVYNENLCCRGVQVLPRWNDIVESTSPILMMNNGYTNMGCIPQIYTRRTKRNYHPGELTKLRHGIAWRAQLNTSIALCLPLLGLKLSTLSSPMPSAISSFAGQKLCLNIRPASYFFFSSRKRAQLSGP